MENKGSKSRKPYSTPKIRKIWTPEEKDKFLEVMRKHGRNWKILKECFGDSRTTAQLRSYEQKLRKKGVLLPPPRHKAPHQTKTPNHVALPSIKDELYQPFSRIPVHTNRLDSSLILGSTMDIPSLPDIPPELDYSLLDSPPQLDLSLKLDSPPDLDSPPEPDSPPLRDLPSVPGDPDLYPGLVATNLRPESDFLSLPDFPPVLYFPSMSDSVVKNIKKVQADDKPRKALGDIGNLVSRKAVKADSCRLVTESTWELQTGYWKYMGTSDLVRKPSITVNILHRFLSVVAVKRSELQLVGISSMLIASKYEEIWAPEVHDLMFVSDNAYVRKEILVMEKAILGIIQWSLTVPTLYVFLARYTQASICNDVEMQHMVFYLATLGLMEYQFAIRYRPSLIAAGAVYAARCMLDKTPFWNKRLTNFRGYAEMELVECAQLLVNLHSWAGESKLKAIFKKFSGVDNGWVALVTTAIKRLTI